MPAVESPLGHLPVDPIKVEQAVQISVAEFAKKDPSLNSVRYDDFTTLRRLSVVTLESLKSSWSPFGAMWSGMLTLQSGSG